MRIAYFTKGERGKVCLDALIENDLAPELIVRASPQDVTAIKGAESISPANVNAPEFIEYVAKFAPDLTILAGFTQIIKPALIKTINQYGPFINLHGGKLPDYRGGSPLNWQIINGEPEIGLSIIEVHEEIDKGRILNKRNIPFDQDQDINDAYRIANTHFPEMLLETTKQIQNGTVQYTVQDESRAVYYGSRWDEDSNIDWKTMTDIEIHNRVRALTTPLNGAITHLENREMRILKTRLLDTTYIHEPGKAFLKRDGGVVVMAQNRGLLVEKVKYDHAEKLARDVIKGTHTYLGE